MESTRGLISASSFFMRMDPISGHLEADARHLLAAVNDRLIHALIALGPRMRNTRQPRQLFPRSERYNYFGSFSIQSHVGELMLQPPTQVQRIPVVGNDFLHPVDLYSVESSSAPPVFLVSTAISNGSTP
jgi:hypothetical protein